MANDLAVFQEQGHFDIAPQFANAVIPDDLSAGVGGGFAVISMRGGKWRIKHQGNELPITDANGDPVGSLEIVVLKANPYLTKQFYGKSYEEGDSGAPVCFSLDGVKPAEGVEQVQAKTCASCPQNVFGSRITPAGKKAKACQDNRKLAVTPLQDLRNEAFGGPMLFRVPPSALKDFAQFSDQWKARGYPYNALAVRIGFDLSASYPKPTIRAIRPLTSDEADTVLELAHSDAVEKILADFDAPAAAEAAPEVEGFEQPQAAAAPAPAPKPAPAAKPAAAPAAKPAAAPVAAQAAVATKAPAATFGAAAAPAAAPAKPKAPPKAAKAASAPVAASEEGEENEEAGDPSAGGSLDEDIASILADLSSVAG